MVVRQPSPPRRAHQARARRHQHGTVEGDTGGSLRRGRLPGCRDHPCHPGKAHRMGNLRPTYCPDVPQAFATYERLRRKRVERIVAHGARTSNSKAAGPIARKIRDLMMPMILKRVANGGALAWMHDYHIDWSAKVA